MPPGQRPRLLSARAPGFPNVVTPTQTSAINAHFDRFVAGCRAGTLDDRAIAEWMLSLAARWLHAHGYSRANLHLWVTHELDRAKPSPFTAAAAVSKDFERR